jgi:hypothetical protein
MVYRRRGKKNKRIETFRGQAFCSDNPKYKIRFQDTFFRISLGGKHMLSNLKARCQQFGWQRGEPHALKFSISKHFWQLCVWPCKRVVFPLRRWLARLNPACSNNTKKDNQVPLSSSCEPQVLFSSQSLIKFTGKIIQEQWRSSIFFPQPSYTILYIQLLSEITRDYSTLNTLRSGDICYSTHSLDHSWLSSSSKLSRSGRTAEGFQDRPSSEPRPTYKYILIHIAR